MAEGVETVAQLDVLRGYGCDEVQGHVVTRPLPGEAFAAFRKELLEHWSRHDFLYILNHVRVGRAEGRGQPRQAWVSFEEAGTVFGDPDALDGPDLRHSAKESRLLRLGRAVTGRVLIVAYTVRRRGNGESIRIISARRASRKERAAYAAAAQD